MCTWVSKKGKTDKGSLIIEFAGQVEELIAHFAELGYLIVGRIDYAIEQIMGDLNNIYLETITQGVESLTRYNVEWLEENINALKANVPKKNKGIPYAYNMAAAKTNILKCKVKQAERCFFRTVKETPMNEFVGQYLNRLSDYMELLYLLLNVKHKKFVEMEEK